MEGGFNDVVARARRRGAVRRRRDRAGSTACSRPTAASAPSRGALQLSHWTLDNELAQLQTFGFLVPAIFLASPPSS